MTSEVMITFGNGSVRGYGYDKYDRVTSITANGKGYTYDANGQIARVTDMKNIGVTTYSYSRSGALTSVDAP